MKKKLISTGIFFLTSLLLGACSSQTSTTSTSSETTDTSTSLEEIPYTSTQSSEETTAHEDVRLNFNSIHVAHAADNFVGGTTLEELIALYGEPTETDQEPAGDVTLDIYQWQIDDIKVIAQLFDNSTVARSISNFTFVRDATITRETYDSLTDGMNYKKAVELLGEPDDLAETVTSDSETINAVWVSGIDSKSTNPSISLTFTNDSLTAKKQQGLDS